MDPRLWALEKSLLQQGFQRIAGIDEAGRGPLAGPVVAAACILPCGDLSDHFDGLNDSKQISALVRKRLFIELLSTPGVYYGIGWADVSTIDKINILQASLLAMRHAVEALPPQPDYLLIDGRDEISCLIPQEAIIGGDGRSASIAAASVLAKVTRDDYMEKLHRQHPEYGFAQHKGYGTKQHFAALAQHGLSSHHRHSFCRKII